MRTKSHRQSKLLVASLLSLAMLSGCTRSQAPPPDAQSEPEPLKKLGVFVETGKDLVEVPHTEQIATLDQTYFYPLEPAALPNVTSVSAFLVNLPGAQITSAEAYLADKLDTIETYSTSGKRIQVPCLREATATEIPISIEQVSPTVFRITSAQFGTSTSGFGFVKIPMGLGNRDRIYPVSLGQ